jgi:hypothetical protein
MIEEGVEGKSRWDLRGCLTRLESRSLRQSRARTRDSGRDDSFSFLLIGWRDAVIADTLLSRFVSGDETELGAFPSKR